MPVVHRHAVLPAILLAAAATCGCERLLEETSPQQPSATPTPLAPVPLVIVNVPLPAPTPTPTAPAPAPSATPPPSANRCTLPPGTGPGTNCPRQSPSFLAEVERAMDQLVRQEPGIFDQGKTRGCGNCFYVTNPTRYVNRMAELMNEQGLCGHYDGEELGVKNSNAFNDQYDILTADMYIRRQGGSYRSTCYPAWF